MRYLVRCGRPNSSGELLRNAVTMRQLAALIATKNRSCGAGAWAVFHVDGRFRDF